MASAHAPGTRDEVHSAALPIHLGVIEVLEYFILLQQHRPKMDKSVKFKLRTVGSADNGNEIWFQVKVSANVDPSAVQLGQFLTSHGCSLRQCVLSIQGTYEGFHLWTDFADVNDCQRTVRQTWMLGMVNQTDHFQTTYRDTKSCGYTLTFVVCQEEHHMVARSQEVYSHMHKVKVTHPEMRLAFHLDINGVKSSSFFQACEIPAGVTRICPRSSPSIAMNGCRLDSSGQAVTLRNTVYVSAVPPQQQSRENHNHNCTGVQVVFFGPNDLPLLLPGLRLTSPGLSSLLHPQDYGLRFSTTLQHSTSAQGVISFDWDQGLQPLELEEEGCGRDREDNRTDGSESRFKLLLFIFLDLVPSSGQTCLEQLDLLARLRENISEILCQQRVKFCKALSNALNKQLCNYTAQEQKQNVLLSAITTVTRAVSDVILHSTDHHFRRDCFTIMEAEDTKSVEHKVRKNLWDIARTKYNIVAPACLGSGNHGDQVKGKPVSHSFSKVNSEESQQQQSPWQLESPTKNLSHVQNVSCPGHEVVSLAALSGQITSSLSSSSQQTDSFDALAGMSSPGRPLPGNSLDPSMRLLPPTSTSDLPPRHFRTLMTTCSAAVGMQNPENLNCPWQGQTFSSSHSEIAATAEPGLAQLPSHSPNLTNSVKETVISEESPQPSDCFSQLLCSPD